MSDIYDEAYCYTIGENETVIYLDEKLCLGQDTGNAKPNNMQQLNTQGDVQSRIKDFLRDNTIISYFIMNKLYDFILHKEEHPVYDYDIVPKYMISGKRGMWTMSDKLYEEFGRKGLEKAGLYMGKLVELAKKHDIKLTIAVYPWPAQIYHNDLNSRQVAFWKKFATENNIGFLNYFPCFIKLNKDKPLKTLDEYFIERDIHWNEKGHGLIADAFLKFYRESNFDYCN